MPVIRAVFLFISICGFCCMDTYGQNNRKVSGTIVDSMGKGIGFASIRLTSATDTTEQYSSERDGSFTFRGLAAGSFTLTISLLGYERITATYQLQSDQKNLELPPLLLKPLSYLLNEVTVNDKPVAIVMKKDTVEYNAAAYPVMERDLVEDLLRQLPGIEIDELGNVTMEGKPMNRLRVNGKDFFSGNVAEFINQLPAGMVSKIQVIDDFGDEANFTGIKIGESQKLLNIVTKPGMDRGKFGYASANANTNSIYNIAGNANLWKDSRQIGLGTNLSTTSNVSGTSNANGVNLTANDEVSKSLRYNSNYSYSANRNNLSNNVYSETINLYGTILNNSSTSSEQKNKGHNLVAGLNYRPGDKFFLTVNPALNINDNTNLYVLNSQQRGLIRQNLTSLNSTRNHSYILGLSANTGIRFTKKGRAMSAGVYVNATNNENNQNADDRFIYLGPTGNSLKDSLLNRIITVDNKSQTFGLSYNFTEPLNNRMNIDLTYSMNRSDQDNLFLTDVRNQADVVSRVDSLSNIYKYTVTTHRIGLNYRYHKEKITASFGLNINPTSMHARYQGVNRDVDNRSTNTSPSANISYAISKGKNLNFSYSGSSIAPLYNQLQPVKDTRNLQNVILGNPNLKPSFRHSSSFNYRVYDEKTSIALMLGVSGGFVQNQIVSNTVLVLDTLSSLKQVTTYENVDGNSNMGFNYNLSFPLFKIGKQKTNLALYGQTGYNNNVSFADNIRNTNSGFNFSQSAQVNMGVKRFSINASASYNYGRNAYTLRQGRMYTIQNWRFNLSGNATVWNNYQLGFSANKTITDGFTALGNDPLLISLRASREFFKKNVLNVSIQVNDLLNQGNFVSRNVSGNTISDTRTNFLTRFVQVNMSMRLSKFGGKSG